MKKQENTDLGSVDLFTMGSDKKLPMYEYKGKKNIVTHDFLLSIGFYVFSIEEGLDRSTGNEGREHPFEIIIYKNNTGQTIRRGLMGYDLINEETDSNKTLIAETKEEFIELITLNL